MRNGPGLPWALGLVIAVAGPAAADVWDTQTENDNTTATENELVHGSDQLHDLGALPGPLADEDWFRLRQRAFSSFEVVVDGISGDAGPVLGLDRVGPDGSTVIQSSTAAGLGFSRSLRWMNSAPVAVDNEFIRARSGGCTTGCGVEDVYRLRFSDTTYAISRFNNSREQATVLLVQNAANYTINGAAYFWNQQGTQVATFIFTLAPRQLLTLDTQLLAPDVSGSMTIAHDGGYGELTGKAVVLQPSSGLGFEHPMVPRPR
jgi:hypothetical protein